MFGQMMSWSLTIPKMLEYAAAYHADTEIVTRTVEGPIHRYGYGDAAKRTRKLANALKRLGVAEGDILGTVAWNTYRHFEIYYAVSGIGAICHTINPRLFPEQIAYIANHAEDKYLFVDLTFVPLLDKLAPHLKGVKGYVIMTDRAHMPASTTLPNAICYEELIADEPDTIDWPDIDERLASSLCYTSATTGNPRGVLYSHRSTVLHSFGACLGLESGSATNVVLPVVPMFHVNAWGVPYWAPMVGCKLVFPGPGMDGASLQSLMNDEGVQLALGVPTVWLNLLNYLDANDKQLTTLKNTVIGGSACPQSMIEAFDKRGVHVVHAWGMTEMSPLGTVNSPKVKHLGQTHAQKMAFSLKQGRPIFGVEIKIVDAENKPLPWDGVAFGALKVRGPWICNSYFKAPPQGTHDADGWFDTGDVATVDTDGYIELVDRTKDVIKSGGEWISSIQLENVAMAHPAVREAAAIARHDTKWSERPRLILVLKDGAKVTTEEMRTFFEGKVAKWAVPDDVVIVDQLPHTATGKILKRELRDKYGTENVAS
ncbi:MAG TPA: long-chain-fatty-acid--CoA ligase [Magnetospirillaceae bacterium]|jgi:fatty-acyl-CoA synthase